MLTQLNIFLTNIVRIISGLSLVFLMAISFADSIGRKLGNPILGAQEFVQLALMTFFLSAIAFVIRSDGNIRVGLLADLYSPRLSAIETWFTGILEACATLFLAWMLYDQGNRLEEFGTLSPFFRMPMAPWVWGGACVSLIAVWFSFQNLHRTHQSIVNRPRAAASGEEE